MPFRCTTVLALALAFCDMLSCNASVKVEVELNVYSGRRNPKWELPPDKGSRLLTSISSLPEEKADLSDPGLGYRGFILRTGDRIIRVYRGLIAIEDHGQKKVFRDTANVEATLADDARQRGYSNLVTDAPSAH